MYDSLSVSGEVLGHKDIGIFEFTLCLVHCVLCFPILETTNNLDAPMVVSVTNGMRTKNIVFGYLDPQFFPANIFNNTVCGVVGIRLGTVMES